MHFRDWYVMWPFVIADAPTSGVSGLYCRPPLCSLSFPSTRAEARNVLADTVVEPSFYVRLRLGLAEVSTKQAAFSASRLPQLVGKHAQVKTEVVHNDVAPKFLKDVRMGVSDPENDVLRVSSAPASGLGKVCPCQTPPVKAAILLLSLNYDHRLSCCSADHVVTWWLGRMRCQLHLS